MKKATIFDGVEINLPAAKFVPSIAVCCCDSEDCANCSGWAAFAASAEGQALIGRSGVGNGFAQDFPEWDLGGEA